MFHYLLRTSIDIAPWERHLLASIICLKSKQKRRPIDGWTINVILNLKIELPFVPVWRPWKVADCAGHWQITILMVIFYDTKNPFITITRVPHVLKVESFIIFYSLPKEIVKWENSSKIVPKVRQSVRGSVLKLSKNLFSVYHFIVGECSTRCAYCDSDPPSDPVSLTQPHQ